MDYQHALSAAVDAVRRASRLCRAVAASPKTREALDKRDRSPVTVADFGVQAVIISAIQRAFPAIPVVGEEDASLLRDPEQAGIREQVVRHVREMDGALDESAILGAIDAGNHGGGPTGCHWALDPIDGTKGFLRGDQYAIALGLIEEGTVVLGVLGCPNLDHQGATGCLFAARRGGGATVSALDEATDSPIAVRRVERLADASFCESVESGHTRHDHAARIAERLGVTAPPVRIDSQCKYAAIARGDAAVYLRLPTRADYEEKIWDHAGGVIVVEEAGGTVTDCRGEPLDFSVGRTLARNKGVICTNGSHHHEVVTAVREVLELD